MWFIFRHLPLVQLRGSAVIVPRSDGHCLSDAILDIENTVVCLLHCQSTHTMRNWLIDGVWCMMGLLTEYL